MVTGVDTKSDLGKAPIGGIFDRLDALIARFFWWAVAAVTLIGLIFRLPGLSSRSLWIDELYSEWFASRSWHDLWVEVPQYETHPPMYYSMLKLWMGIFGHSEAGMRSLSLVASLLTIVTLAVAGRALRAGRLGDRASLLAALLLAANYGNIRFALDSRPYGPQTLFVTLAILASLALGQRLCAAPESGNRAGWGGWALILGLAGGFSLWLHNTGFFVASGIWGGLGLVVLFGNPARRLVNLAIVAGTGLLALLVWGPGISIFLHQSGAFSGLSFWIKPRIPDLYEAWMQTLGDGWPQFIFGLVLLLIGIVAMIRLERTLAVQVLVILLLPLYAVLAVSFTVKPIYINRLFEWMAPLTLAVVAFGLVAWRGPRWIGVCLAVVMIGWSSARSIADEGRITEDWRSVITAIGDNAQPGDVVIALPAQGLLAVEYYARRYPNFPDRVYVPGPYPQRHLPRIYVSNLGGPMLIEDDLKLVDAALATHKRVWFIHLAPQLYDPKGMVLSRIKAALHFSRAYGNQLSTVELFD